MELAFRNPEYFWLLTLIPLGLLLRRFRPPPAALKFPASGLLQGLGGAGAQKFLVLLRLLAFLGLSLGLCRPQQDGRRRQVQASGIDMVLAVDVSGSMLAHDFTLDNRPASRLDVVKRVLGTFIENRPSDRMGFVAFAVQPYLVSPPTLNHHWLQQNLERLRVGLVDPSGTAIGSAIAMAANRLRTITSKSKVLILLTDGQSNSGKVSPIMAAEAAAAYGIKIYTIFAGTDGLVPVPIVDPAGNFLRDASGALVFEKAYMSSDESSLKEIAEKTGGVFFRATDTASLKKIYKRIDELEKTEARVYYSGPVHEWFYWPVGLAVALLLLEVLLTHTRYRRLP